MSDADISSPDAGHPLLQKLIDSIEIMDDIACFDYAAMYDVRDALSASGDAKPVAWTWNYMGQRGLSFDRLDAGTRTATPLYAAPVPAGQDAKRSPVIVSPDRLPPPPETLVSTTGESFNIASGPRRRIVPVRVGQDAIDARRYRWLRSERFGKERLVVVSSEFACQSPCQLENLDAAIDAAMGSKAQTPGETK